MPNTLDPELTKPLDEVVIEEDDEEDKNEKGVAQSPYVTPFFINYAASPPPCRKHWDLLVDECQGMLACIFQAIYLNFISFLFSFLCYMNLSFTK